MEVAIGRMIKCSRLSYSHIVGSKQNVENLKKIRPTTNKSCSFVK
jgi:hypothetical protein